MKNDDIYLVPCFLFDGKRRNNPFQEELPHLIPHNLLNLQCKARWVDKNPTRRKLNPPVNLSPVLPIELSLQKLHALSSLQIRFRGISPQSVSASLSDFAIWICTPWLRDAHAWLVRQKPSNKESITLNYIITPHFSKSDYVWLAAKTSFLSSFTFTQHYITKRARISVKFRGESKKEKEREDAPQSPELGIEENFIYLYIEKEFSSAGKQKTKFPSINFLPQKWNQFHPRQKASQTYQAWALTHFLSCRFTTPSILFRPPIRYRHQVWNFVSSNKIKIYTRE